MLDKYTKNIYLQHMAKIEAQLRSMQTYIEHGIENMEASYKVLDELIDFVEDFNMEYTSNE